MEIKTKFNVGDKVWVIKSQFRNSVVAELEISKINIIIMENDVRIAYRILGEDFNESVVFATKEELRKHFFGE